MIFLDSDVLIHIIDKKSEQGKTAIAKLRQYPNETIAISTIVLEEVLFGLLKQLNQDKINQLLEIPSINFDAEMAVRAANIEIEMEKIGQKKPRADMLIAATTITEGGILYSFNLAHYKDIPGLSLIV